MAAIRRHRFLPHIFTSNKSRSPKSKWYTFLPWKEPQPQWTCRYCCETKPQQDFITAAALPYNCQLHIARSKIRICQTCLQDSLSAQLDSKALLEVGCPECSAPWEPEDVEGLINLRDRKKFKRLAEMAKDKSLVPDELPDAVTTEMLLVNGTRFCPWCKWPFIKDGGCEAMQCVKCLKCFNIEYALVLEDKEGHRAAPVIDDVDERVLDDWGEHVD